MSNIFGVDKVYGTISICRAKTQNRGRGRCPHGDHLELTEDESSPENIQKFNEERLAVHFHPLKGEKGKDTFPENLSTNNISTHKGGGTLTRDDFNEATIKLSEAFPEENWDTIQDFYNTFHTRISDGRIQSLFNDTVDNIHSYLNSNDPTVLKVREFLGKDIDLKTFSELLLYNVKSMTHSSYWTPKRSDSIRRIILTSINNDMTKERYVASILFFGGRCCYCNRVLRRGLGENQATGEHITPLNPDEKDSPPGTTRYGNMALCCRACNNERGTENLEKWMNRTKRVPEHLKESSLTRIKTFRRFALYREMTPKEGEIISTTVEKLHSFVQNERQLSIKNKTEIDTKKISDQIKVTIQDLSTLLRQG